MTLKYLLQVGAKIMYLNFLVKNNTQILQSGFFQNGNEIFIAV